MLFVKVPALASVRVIVSVKSTSVFPKASRAVITGCVVKVDPLVLPDGCVVTANVVATISIVVPIPFVTGEVAAIWVFEPSSVRSVSPSTLRIIVWSSVNPVLSLKYPFIVYVSLPPSAIEIDNPLKVIVSAPALYIPTTFEASFPFSLHVTWSRIVSLAVPETFTTICVMSVVSPSPPPPSLIVKLNKSTASPTVSFVVSSPTGSVTPAAAVKLASESAVSVVKFQVVASEIPA